MLLRMLSGTILIAIIAANIATAKASDGAGKPAAAVAVPFVGCKSDDQLGPRPAPKGSNKKLNISASAALKANSALQQSSLMVAQTLLKADYLALFRL